MNCHTEKEATTRLCPMVNGLSDDGDCHCIAARCMAWRWVFDVANVIDFYRERFETAGYQRVKSSAGANGIPMATMVKQTELGYCGLAGERFGGMP